MKKFMYYSFSAVLSLLAFLAFSPQADACIDPDTIATLTINYSDDFSEVEVRVGNLKLHTETPNTFCSCALSGFDEAFTIPTYIAFVEAGTTTPFENFDVWENTTGADEAWDEEFPSFPNWSGYISEVINAGLSTDDDVELVIRASAAPGTFVIVTAIDSFQNLFTLGTDMWLPDVQTMAFDHPGIRSFPEAASSVVVEAKPASYFEQLDNGILSSDFEVEGKNIDLNIFPNPVNEKIWVDFSLPKNASVQFSIRDISGKLISHIFSEDLPEGNQKIPLDIGAILPEHGLYLLEIKVDGEIGVRKFVK